MMGAEALNTYQLNGMDDALLILRGIGLENMLLTVQCQILLNLVCFYHCEPCDDSVLTPLLCNPYGTESFGFYLVV